MQVVLDTKNLPVHSKLRMAVQHKLDRFERVAREATRADVHLSEERNPRIATRFGCKVTLHLRHGTVTAHGAAAEPTAAVDLVLEKLRHRVERLKDQRVKRGPASPRGSRRARTRL